MVQCICAIQEGQADDALQQTLATGLSELTSRYFDDDASINWMLIARGNGFTAGKPSRAFLIAVHAPSAMQQDVRERMLTDVCNLWVRETGCTLNDVVATIGDPPG